MLNARTLQAKSSASVSDVTGVLHSKFGPATKNYFVAKRTIAFQHRNGNLTEDSILEYARAHKMEEATVGLSVLCSLPVNVVERALGDTNREVTLILTKALDFSWETTMALLFLSAKDHRISVADLESLRKEFAGLHAETSRNVLRFYQSRRMARAADSAERRLPQLHS